ncbi:uncharacterized protein PG998_006026 [Apiospora kogelbergensis]|uniref:uncharacterized protein n=1 Tax=Apiospora kogelbergensis TaxID=1337665 RepID=UPI0031302D6A
MRRGFRRGQDIADALRIEIRDLEDRDDLGPRSSPSSPDSPGSTASSASPTKTTFPAVAAPTAAPLHRASRPRRHNPRWPQRRQTPPFSLWSLRRCYPQQHWGGGGGAQPMSKAAIALGVIGGVGFLVAIGFVIWKLWSRKKRAKVDYSSPRAELVGNGQPRPGAGPTGLNRSDSSVMGSLMGHVYRAEDGGSQVGGTYMDEKRRPGSRDDLDPILPREPEPVAQRNESPVGSWLSRQSSTMLNPLTARASMTSSAAGEFRRAQQGQQPRPDDSVSQFGEESPPTLDPRFQPPVPSMPQQFQQQMPQQQSQQQAAGEYYYPIAIDPQKVPPPPAPQRLSVAETNRTSGTWNTWGVQQHRGAEKPKGWKAKLAGRS